MEVIRTVPRVISADEINTKIAQDFGWIPKSKIQDGKNDEDAGREEKDEDEGEDEDDKEEKEEEEEEEEEGKTITF